MGMPGTYLQLSSNDTPPIKLIAPSNKNFGFSVSQKLWTPLQELYDGISNFIKAGVGEAADVATLEKVALATAQGASTIGRLFGVKLMNKGFYAKAWDGEEEVSIEASFDLFMGLNDEWRATTEVYKPIMAFMSATTPAESDKLQMLTSPAPTGIDVFLEYSANALQNMGEAMTKIFSSAGKQVPNKEDISLGRKWTLSVGYSTDGVSIPLPYFEINNLVVKTSSFSFSNSVDTDGAPISGTVTAQCVSSTLIVSSDFTKTGFYKGIK